MKKKLGLCLGAGGARGVAHIGFLQAMEEEGIHADYVSGCSMGSIVGACYSAGVSPEKMKETVLGLKLNDIATLNLNPLHKNGLMRMDKARKLIVSLIGGEKNFHELPTPFRCVTTDLIRGETVVLKEGNVADSVLASSCIPGVFTPITLGQYEMLVDGCVLERVPTLELKRMGSEVIVAVDVLGNLPYSKEASGQLINTLLRCIDIVDTRSTERKRKEREYVDLWLEPALGDMDQYRLKDFEFALEKGYELGKENAPKIKELIGA